MVDETIVDSADVDLDAGGLERLAHRLDGARLARDAPGVAVVDDVVGAGVEGGQHHVVLGEALGHEHDAAPG